MARPATKRVSRVGTPVNPLIEMIATDDIEIVRRAMAKKYNCSVTTELALAIKTFVEDMTSGKYDTSST